jgi:hypothetical protein
MQATADASFADRIREIISIHEANLQSCEVTILQLRNQVSGLQKEIKRAHSHPQRLTSDCKTCLYRLKYREMVDGKEKQ